ncbi:MAG: hypothetical protein JW880_01895, partial [Candidatus Thermoplasmatota archaeon]|nr:hypothetical protein [Candidatus Thermoplasmatota archaeon]
MSKVLTKARKAMKEKGVLHVLRSGAEIVSYRLGLNSRFVYHKLTRSFGEFSLQGTKYRYFIHRHNTTWKNERCVEIPIVRKILDEYQGKTVLEVGNVLSHYFAVGHDVVDKYEASPGVVNQDVVDFRPGREYDLIVSISTMEHVGWDEDPREKSKILGEPVKIL